LTKITPNQHFELNVSLKKKPADFLSIELKYNCKDKDTAGYIFEGPDFFNDPEILDEKIYHIQCTSDIMHYLNSRHSYKSNETMMHDEQIKIAVPKIVQRYYV